MEPTESDQQPPVKSKVPAEAAELFVGEDGADVRHLRHSILDTVL